MSGQGTQVTGKGRRWLGGDPGIWGVTQASGRDPDIEKGLRHPGGHPDVWGGHPGIQEGTQASGSLPASCH